MSDETPTDPKPIAAPAVHGETLWGGPQWIHNASSDPVFVRTKKEYWDLLNQGGFRMRDQQESTVGPALAPRPVELPDVLKPIKLLPISQGEAQLYGAMSAIFKRYGLMETIWCQRCFAAHRHHGVRMRVHPKEVSMECRCGKVTYHPPMGTVDTIINKIATTSIVETDHHVGTVLTAAGPEFRPTTVLQDIEAKLIRNYVRVLQGRDKEPRWFHRGCFHGIVQHEDNAVGMSVSEHDIALVCPCRTLFHRRATVQ